MLAALTAPLRLALLFFLIAALVASSLLVPSQALAAAPPISVTGLRANDLVNPLGITGQAPSLSWRSESTGRAVTQKSYEIRAASSVANLESNPVWDSGTVASDTQLNVAYKGPALESSTRYFWQVRVTDNRDNISAWSDAAWFETAFLSNAEWQGSWIAGNDPVPWTDYTVTADFTLKPSSAFGLYLRAANTNNGYMWQLNDEIAGHPRLRPHVKVNGNWSTLPEVDLTTKGLAADVLKNRGTVEFALSGSTIVTKVNGTMVSSITNTQFASGYFGPRTDVSTAEMVTFHSLKVTSAAGVLYQSDFASGHNPFGAGTITGNTLVVKDQVNALYTPATSLPILRKDFTTTPGKTVTSARIYASARGNYELALNGEKVGNQELAPGWTDFTKRFQYQTYDVTSQIQEGANTVGAFLADGWYSGYVAWYGADKYGNQNSLLAQLVVTYSDGSTQTVASDSSWRTSAGPVVSGDLLMGETYDARLEQDGWSEPGFDAASWQPVAVATSTSTPMLHAQTDEPIRITEERPALSVSEVPTGRFIYDIGQNLSGVPEVTLTGVAGQKVTLRHAEVLNKDGSIYVANLRSAKATDEYTFAETGTVTWRPRFTSHGFRYIEISGVTTPPAITDVTALVFHSDITPTSTFETSDPMLNQLHSNIVWGQRGNFVSVPTDTPARDERLGYSGDLNAFAGTATFNFDSLAFIKKWMKDMRDTQTADGEYPESAPRGPDMGCCNGGSAWSDGGITIPWMAFSRYGDTGIITDNWESMEKYFGYLDTNFPTRVRADGPYGDWLDLNDPTPAEVIGTAYYAYDARLMSEMAAAVGKSAEAAEYAALAEQVTDVFVDKFVAADGTITGNSQTAYALALGMDLVPNALRKATGDKLVAKLATRNYHLSTGFVGTPWLMPALSGTGNWDVAYRLLGNKTIPSWGYEVEMGATTMWERWDSIDANGNFGDAAMNSFNHYAFGAVGDWMYQHIGGIQVGDAGYESFTIAPQPGGGITFADTSYDSVYGTIGSDWKIVKGSLSLDVAVPTNTTATVRIPASSDWAVSEGGKSLGDAEGVTVVSTDNGEVVVEVGSGSYAFTVSAAGAALGDLIDEVDALRTTVSTLPITAAQKQHLDATLEDVRSDAVDAAGDLFSDRPAAIANVLHAIAEVRSEVAWLADSGITGAARATLDENLAALESGFAAVAVTLSGLSAEVTATTGALLPGASASIGLALRNEGSSTLGAVTATLDVPAAWQAAPGGAVSLGGLAAGASSTTAFAVTIPAPQLPGSATLPVAVSYDLDGVRLTTIVNAALDVRSGVEVTAATASPTAISPDSRTSVEVTVHNSGTLPTTGRVTLDTPAGWLAPVPSAVLTIEPGTSATATVHAFVPLTLSEETVKLDAVFTRSDTTLAKRGVSFTATTAIPTTEFIDHVDLGNLDSESEHGLTASGRSGAGSEGGKTRRYSGSESPSHFEFTIAAPIGKPFLLSAIETFDGPRTKEYTIIVNGVTVQDRLFTRVPTSVGTSSYQVLVDDPAAFSTTGTVRVRFLHNSSNYDPSIADVWTLAVPADTVKPTLDATVTAAGPEGTESWNRGATTVTLSAADNRPGAVFTEYSLDAGAWTTYSAPVVVSDEGNHTVAYRATDVAGNVTAASSAFGIDATAPVSTATIVTTPADVAAERARITINATDAASGVALTEYSVDGAAFVTLPSANRTITVTGGGGHVLRFRSTDAAGNVEETKQTPFAVATSTTRPWTNDVVVAPAISGTATVGKVLTATRGTWTLPALTTTYTWKRNGTVIAGAPNAATYTVQAADFGASISVLVFVKNGASSNGSAMSGSVDVVRGGVITATKAPAISGTVKVGRVLTASKGTWPQAVASTSYQWLRNGIPISKATKATYKVVAADRTRTLTVRVTVSPSYYAPSVAVSAGKKVPR
ncbi:alfa-L-rhamnosidase [Glaciihabitans arcticus]|uniref:alpha-L-rhamnosidase n=1 Tax=Glaciihabitans arcticus TaxID=2668039 RepID=A0A4Q9GNX9_9MICO|nr:family 78 glycoside hydrolase catalytic domain [Glaciihabitans arcticus]TBN56436.1 alfa-L-rhamnosidase [Glaciihabitans arcticus]